MVRRPTDSNRLSVVFPDIAAEWDIERNTTLTPDNIGFGSNKEVWWRCSKCGFGWEAPVCNRTSKSRRGCPACSNRVVTDKNRLSFVCPQLVSSWNSVKNYPITADAVSFGSHRSVWWVCGLCKYEWKAPIKSRTILNSGCPSCSGLVASDRNRLSVRCPGLLCEWDYKNNKDLVPEGVSCGSGKKVWWVCQRCGNSWKAIIKNRVANRCGCPKCAIGNSSSKLENKWLDIFNIPIEFRQYKIRIGSRRFTVDGFDPTTNTIYEFLGDFWHGNPNVYSRYGLHRVKKCKTFGELYSNTMSRLKLFENSGYKVVYVWEEDYCKLYT